MSLLLNCLPRFLIYALGIWVGIVATYFNPKCDVGKSDVWPDHSNLFKYFGLWMLFLHSSNFIVISAEWICIQFKSILSLIGLCSKKLSQFAIRPQVNELWVENDYYVTLMYFLFLIITNTYCGLLHYGRRYAHLFYSFYLEIRSVKCSL